MYVDTHDVLGMCSLPSVSHVHSLCQGQHHRIQANLRLTTLTIVDFVIQEALCVGVCSLSAKHVHMYVCTVSSE